MSQNCACRVSLEEIAEKGGFLPFAAVASHADRLGIAVADDWTGRPSVAVGDAGRLYAAATGSAEENHLANQARMRAEMDATAAREAAENDIFNTEYSNAVRRGVPGPRAYERAAEAVGHARTVGTLKKIADAAKKAVGV